MLCIVCKKSPAKVHLTQIVGEKMQKVDLCEECAKTKGVNDSADFTLADLLLGLGAGKEIAQNAEGEDLKCPVCGFTQADFKKAGRLGCSDCYQTFAEGLEGLLKSMHKGTKHVGKVPQALRQTKDMNDRLKNLQKKLDRAIVEEDFEDAARLRDEIKGLKEKISHLPIA
ncbi:MAG: mcsA [Verrucomicrobiales bacterium]|nr:mcsA [Verrucomicrobiales bacterium]MDB6129520.1 mcsA [Verrucomicrobiales bacterium]